MTYLKIDFTSKLQKPQMNVSLASRAPEKLEVCGWSLELHFFFLTFRSVSPALSLQGIRIEKILCELRPLSKKEFKGKTVCTRRGTTFLSVTQPSAYPNYSNSWLVPNFSNGAAFSHPIPSLPTRYTPGGPASPLNLQTWQI